MKTNLTLDDIMIVAKHHLQLNVLPKKTSYSTLEKEAFMCGVVSMARQLRKLKKNGEVSD